MLLDVLADAAEAGVDHPALVTGAGELGFGDWAARGAALGAGLRERGIGSFAVAVADAPTLLAVLAGAAQVGAEACTYSSTAAPELVAELADAFGHDVLVTDRADLAGLAEGGRAVLSPDELAVAGAGRGAPAPAAPLLVLTTGTTGRPKAVRHDWRRLLSGVRAAAVPPGSRWLLTYNLNQFAGLQVVLHAVAGRATLVVPPTNQPRAALAFARDHGVTHVSATPTFWRIGLGTLDGDGGLDLAHLTLGGEAVPGPLLEDLRRRFPAAGISQIYASTEGGSVVSVTDGRAGLPVSVLDRGPDHDVQLRIVDGELQVRSRVGMLGYRGEEAGGDPDGWRPTGDLVDVVDDRILFVGRTSEVINVGGVKVHPRPIEEAALEVDGVSAAHAYARSSPVSGQIVQLDVVAAPGLDEDDLEDAIRAACGHLAPAARPQRIRFVEELEVREHKVVRRPR
jgi:acyl-CoA synthetase (AMP-forming)/AMP-acid ligase II